MEGDVVGEVVTDPVGDEIGDRVRVGEGVRECDGGEDTECLAVIEGEGVMLVVRDDIGEAV